GDPWGGPEKERSAGEPDGDRSAGQPDGDRSGGKEDGPTGLTSLFGDLGERHDLALGRVHLGARWYEPTRGRFLGPDRLAGSLGRPLSQHRYLYALANPTTLLDRTGRSASSTLSSDPYSYDGSAYYGGPSPDPSTDLAAAVPLGLSA